MMPIFLECFMSEYIFSAAPIKHRCRIPECGETSNDDKFQPEWINDAIPRRYRHGTVDYDNCKRFAPSGHGGNGSLDHCPASLFNENRTVFCDGLFVYKSSHTIVNEFNLGCQEWMRAMAGTMNTIGTLLVLPITGYVSDRWGRRVALCVSVFNLVFFGFIRAFSVNYAMYLVLQLLQTTFGAGCFSSAYIFATELVGTKYRSLTSAIINAQYSIGAVVMAGVAYKVQNWRKMILILYSPCFLVVFYYWLLPESARWLLSKQRYAEAREVLEKVSRINGRKDISDASWAAISRPPEVQKQREGSLVKHIFRSRVLRRRVLTTPIWWITTTFVFYGLSINSHALLGNMYFNYMLVSLIEIPGYFLPVALLNRIGRKPTLAVSFVCCAICNFVFMFLVTCHVCRIVMYLCGKFFISIVFTSLYQYTSELYPTEYRHSLLAFSSMIGRIGSIMAPLTSPLMQYWPQLPSLLFTLVGMLAGALVLTQPETMNRDMPDTLEEAEALGRSSSSSSSSSSSGSSSSQKPR